MSTELYSAETHVFSNPNGSDIYIKPQEGQNLYIEGFTSGDVLPGNGLEKVGEDLNVLVDELSIEINGENKLQVKDQGIITGHIMNSAVTNEKLQQSTITVTAGTGLTGGGSVELGTSTELAVDDTVVRTSGTQSIIGDKVFNRILFQDTDSPATQVSIAASISTEASYALTLPVNAGTANQVLATDGAGVLSWVVNNDGSGAAGGANKQVQFNDSGVFGTDATLAFDKTTHELSANTLVTNLVEHRVSTDSQGKNELYSSLQTLDQNTSGSFLNTGVSLSITSNNALSGPKTVICAGAPISGETVGGVLTYNSINNAAFGTPTAYQAASFCTDYAGEFSDISDDGQFLAYSQQENNAIKIYRYNSGSGNYGSVFQSITGFKSCKVCGTGGNYLLVSNHSNLLRVYLYETTFTLQQTISTQDIRYFDIFAGGTIIYFVTPDHVVHVWGRSGTTWTETFSFSIASGYISFAFQNYMVIVGYPTQVKIYDSSLLTATFSDTGIVSVCTNGTYIFYATSTNIYILHHDGTTWVKSVNPTTTTGVARLSCNTNRLVVGRPTIDTYGRINVYSIVSYSNTIIPENSVDLGSGNLVINSRFNNVNITGNAVNVTGPTAVTGSLAASGALSLSSTTNATSTTSGGTFTTAGGAAVAKDLYLGGNVYMGASLGSVPFIINRSTIDNVNSTSSITIPAGITHLRIMMVLWRGSGSTSATLGIRFNGDFGNNYQSLDFNTIGSSTNSATFTASYASIGLINYGNAMTVVDIPYATTTGGYKHAQATCSVYTGGTSRFTWMSTWTNGAAITGVSLVSSNGTVNYSGEFTMYGYV